MMEYAPYAVFATATIGFVAKRWIQAGEELESALNLVTITCNNYGKLVRALAETTSEENLAKLKAKYQAINDQKMEEFQTRYQAHFEELGKVRPIGKRLDS